MGEVRDDERGPATRRQGGGREQQRQRVGAARDGEDERPPSQPIVVGAERGENGTGQFGGCSTGGGHAVAAPGGPMPERRARG